MRSEKRIKPFLKYVNWFYLLHNQWNLFNSKLIAKIYTDNIKSNIKQIHKYWKKNPDLRISQVLVNLNILPNISGLWYYKEEDEILTEQEPTHPENYLFWTSILKSNNRIRNKPKTKLIKDLSKSHILAIFKYVEGRKRKLPKSYLTALNNTLNKKQWNNIKKFKQFISEILKIIIKH